MEDVFQLSGSETGGLVGQKNGLVDQYPHEDFGKLESF